MTAVPADELLGGLVRVVCNWTWQPHIQPLTEEQEAHLREALSGPLAPLLAKLQAIEALAEDLALHTVEPVRDEERGFIRGLECAARSIRTALATAGDDGWAGYTTERAELASFLAATKSNTAVPHPEEES